MTALDATTDVTIDNSISRWIVEHRCGLGDDVAAVVTHGGTVWAAVLVIVLGMLSNRLERRQALAALGASGVTWLVVSSLKRVIGRPRPPVAWRLVAVDDWAMPSGHAAQGAVVGAVLWMALPTRLRWLGAVYTTTIALTRVVLGVHWASDVVIGALIGWMLTRLIARIAVRPSRQSP